jgi:hypothetical protein
MGTSVKQQAEEWLKLMGSTPIDIQDPGTEWHFQFDYPANTPHIMHVAVPKERPSGIVIVSGTDVSHEHLEAFAALDDEAKEDFLWDLRNTLNVVDVDFKMEGVSGDLDCPTQVKISVTRYEDGLTLDSFARSVGAVFKTELNGIWVILRHLGGKRFGTGGRFDFKRLGY